MNAKGKSLMKRHAAIAGCVALAMFCAGCGVDHVAKKLVAKEENRGILALSFYPTGEEMVKKQRISLHEVCKGADETPIDVWVIKARGSDGNPAKARATMLVLHSRHENKASLPYLGAAERLAKKGYDVVLPDLRAHGRSGGDYITYGSKEKHDLKAVMDTLIREGHVHSDVYVFGVNLSGAVAIHYAAIDERCKGVMAVAPYLDFPSIARYQHFAMGEKDIEKAISKAAEMAGFDPGDTNTAAAAEKLKCPLLIVHGFLDASAPIEHAKAIYEAAPEPKKLVQPVLERFLTLAFIEDWIADQMDSFATKGLPKDK